MSDESRSGEAAEPPPEKPGDAAGLPPAQADRRRLIRRLLRLFRARARPSPEAPSARASADNKAPDADPVALAHAVLAARLPTKLERRSQAVRHFVGAARDGVLTLLALVVAGFAAYFGYNEWSDDRPLIGKIEAPRELDEAGYGPAVLARMLSDELKEILQTSLVPVTARSATPGLTEAERPPPGGEQRKQGGRGLALQSYRSDPIKGAAYKESESRVPEFEVVGVGFSLSDIIRTLKGQFGSLPLEIGGEVVRVGEDYGYILRLNGERVEFVRGDLLRAALPDDDAASASTGMAIQAGDALGLRLKRIMNAAALAVLKHTEPIAWAIHGYGIGRRNGVLPVLDRYLVCRDASGEAVEDGLRPMPLVASLDVPRAWLLKGLIERDGGDAEEARLAFACARDTALAFEAENDEAALRRSVVLANAYENLSAYEDAEKVYASVAGTRPNNAAILMGWASLLATVGEFGNAAEKYQEAALAEPGQIDALVALARVQDRLGRPHEAAATFERASEIAPLDASDHIDWGNTLMSVGHLTQAAASFAEAVRIDPDNPDAYLNWGYALWGLGEYQRANKTFDQAILKFEQAVRREPGNTEKRTGYALALFARGRVAEADQEFMRLAANDPENPAVYYQWGNTYLWRGDPLRAIEKFRTLVALDPLPWNLILLGDAHWNAGQLAPAREQYQAAVNLFQAEAKAKPGDTAVLNGLASTFMRLERPADAAGPLAEAVHLDPDNPRQLVDRASVLSVLGKADEAAEHFQRAIRIDPLDPWPVWSWARELMLRGAYRRAAETFEQLVATLDPVNGWNYVDWGDALYASGARYQEDAKEAYLTAATRFEAALAHSPDPGPLYGALAFARQKAGDLAGAAAAYESLAAYDKASPWDHAAWGDALSAIGEADAAQQRYATAEANFRSLIQSQPDNPNPRRGLATFFAGHGRFEEAARVYSELAALTADDPWDHLVWADALVSAGKTAEAERIFALAFEKIEVARQRHPHSAADLIAAAARALERLGRYAEASAKWSEVAALQPDDPWSLAAAADMLWADQKADRASPLYEAALQRFLARSAKEPDNLALQQGRAQVLSRLGRNQEAADLYVGIAALAPGDFWAQIDAGSALANAGRFDAALVHFERASTIAPERRDGWYYSGLALADLGRYEAAIEKFKKLTEIDPRDADAYANWARCLEAQGRQDEAAEIWRRWRELQPAETTG
ncbi:MAG: tetratricopeptide repeat protein [Alphaproteobacteria bacterium]